MKLITSIHSTDEHSAASLDSLLQGYAHFTTYEGGFFYPYG